MKEQKFENFDSFNPDEWYPVKGKEFYFTDGNKDGLYGWFMFDVDWGCWRGRIAESVIYRVTSEMDIKDVNNIKNDIRNRFEKWNIYPESVSWLWRGHRYDICDDFHGALNNIVDPEPFMVYKTCERIEDCEIKSIFYLERVSRAVYLEFKKTVCNNDADLPKMWDVFVEQMRKHVRVPFTAKLSEEKECTEE